MMSCNGSAAKRDVGAAMCGSAAERRAYAAWRQRLEALDVQLSETDLFVVALVATREVRLRDLGREVARTKMPEKLRVIALERLAAADLTKAVDQIERVFGSRVGEAKAETGAMATGTDGRVVEFPRRAPSTKAKSVAAQRIAAALGGGASLTKAALRAQIPGSQGVFLSGLREAMESGAVAREGGGTSRSPFHYRRGTA